MKSASHKPGIFGKVTSDRQLEITGGVVSVISNVAEVTLALSHSSITTKSTVSDL